MFVLQSCSILVFISLVGDFCLAKTQTAVSLAKCCNEGRKRSGVVVGFSSCTKKPLALSNPSKMCLSVYKICCMKKERHQCCQKGEMFARDANKDISCAQSSSKNTLHGSTFLECCECCKLGKTAAKENKSCGHDDLPFNGTCGGIYQRCCAIAKRISDTKTGPANCAEAKCNHGCQVTESGPICSCRRGFLLMNDSRTCKDVNECKTGEHKCIAGWRCTNLIGTYRCLRATPTRKCRKGYLFENGICRDIDECSSGTANCPSGTVCENILGSHLCTKKVGKKCPTGYQFVGVRCIDFNECKERNPCRRGFRCVNTYGSYHCSAIKKNCPRGYVFSNTSMACLDLNECTLGTHTCKKDSEMCRNVHGSYRCICRRGFLKKNGRCEDQDECKIYRGRLCNQKCTNLPGSYRCECSNGFYLAGNKRTCLDTNECRQKDTCSAGQKCFNLPGTHKCIQTSCRSNYIQRTSRSCKLRCPAGVNCDTLPVSVKWFAVSRRGPIKRFGFRLIYDVDVSNLFDVQRVVFTYEKGNEEKEFRLQKYGFSKVIIYNNKPLEKTRYYHLRVVGTAQRALGKSVKFEYNLHAFIYVPL